MKKLYYFINPAVFSKYDMTKYRKLYRIEEFKMLFPCSEAIYPMKLLLWSDFAIRDNKFIKNRHQGCDGRFVSTEKYISEYVGSVVWHYQNRLPFTK